MGGWCWLARAFGLLNETQGAFHHVVDLVLRCERTEEVGLDDARRVHVECHAVPVVEFGFHEPLAVAHLLAFGDAEFRKTARRLARCETGEEVCAELGMVCQELFQDRGTLHKRHFRWGKFAHFLSFLL